MKAQMIFMIFALFVFSLNFASAITVSDVSQEGLFPGESSRISIDLKNNLDEDVEMFRLIWFWRIQGLFL